jgi:hypothetical protein
MSEQSPSPKEIPCPLANERRGTEAVLSDSSQKEHASVRRESDALADFSRHVHSYICGCIQFADQKAGFLFAFVGAILAYEFQKNLHSGWLKSPSLWSAMDLTAFLSMLSFLASQFLAASVVVPRFRSSRSRRGTVYFRSITGYRSSGEYASKVCSLADAELSHALLEHAYDLAKICDSKYFLLTSSLWIAFVGTLFGILAMLSQPLG